MAAGGHFGCPKITFGRISGHFRSIQIFYFFYFYKMASGAHFGCPKFTFDRISGHFRSICNFNLFMKFLTKWLTSAILDVRNSLSTAFLAISDRYAECIFFRRTFWMSENHFGSHFWPFQIDRPFWMSEIHFRCHFWPFQTHMELYFYFFWQNGRRRSFWMSENHFRSHLRPFQIDTQLFFFFFLTKWSPAAFLDGTTMSIIELVRDIRMNNAYVKFEERSLNPSKVIALTTKLWRGCVANINIIFPKTYVSREYNNVTHYHV